MILLTGATGFLGMDALARLLEREDEVAVLVRAPDEHGAQQRLSNLLARLYERPPAAAGACS